MPSDCLKPQMQECIDLILPADFFDLDPWEPAKERRQNNGGAQPGDSGTRKSAQKPLLSGRDFILPMLVAHSDNGDVSVSCGTLADQVQVDQIRRVAECARQAAPTFSELPGAEQKMERRCYSDYLKRKPKNEAYRRARIHELEIYLSRAAQAEANFLSWWE